MVCSCGGCPKQVSAEPLGLSVAVEAASEQVAAEPLEFVEPLGLSVAGEAVSVEVEHPGQLRVNKTAG